MEILEAYCRTIVVAANSASRSTPFTGPQLQDLLKIKQSLGIRRPALRHEGMRTVRQRRMASGRDLPGAGATAKPTIGLDPEAEAAVKAITDQILAQMK